jgi:hypothetical protein
VRARIRWLLRGKTWRTFNLLTCHRCYRRFERDAPGAIDFRSDSTDEAEQCLPFEGYSERTLCPACAAPFWQEAVRIALYRRDFR